MALHSVDDLKQLLEYSPISGQFRWKVQRHKVPAGALAGSRDHHGYVRIKTGRKNIAAHRMAWAFVHGVFPASQIDHVNGVRHDNRLCNLRTATHSENMQNRGCRRNTASGYKGVTKQTNATSFQAHAAVNNRRYYLGTFPTAVEAHEVYSDFVQNHHPFHPTNIGVTTMARAKSVILSPVEKKAITAELKGKLKDAQAVVKTLSASRKDADKLFAAAGKAHVNALKENDKLAAAATKTVESLNAQLTALASPVAA